ncbi:MAG: prenyltransferase/squalene oxidase repeat-containing protein [Planctomycetota bacterium]
MMHLFRRMSLVAGVVFVWGIGLGAQTQPIMPSLPTGEGEMTEGLDEVISNGLATLAGMQNDDGSFGGGQYGRNVAITALACLAFMSDGNLPGRGPYGPIVERGLRWMLEQQTETGLYAAQSSHGPMYGHGFATLFVGEVYGMSGTLDEELSSRVHDSLIRANRLIVRSQNDQGGWRYQPLPEDADVSVTICQVMALRSIRNAGIEVPKETIDKAVEYVRACQNADGGFSYQLPRNAAYQRGSSSWPRSAAGVAALLYAGIYEDEAIDEGIKYLQATALPGSGVTAHQHYYFYGHYYAAQAHFHAGQEAWDIWWPAIRNELIDRQQPDGSWNSSSVGQAYGTAMALIILQMPKRYLPIFQQ